ncbi:MAG TPA: DUF1552 domain-containing protein [Polyangiaceae bacterium]|nr:DUF1552 domain-containing protein [Polyangiaceae bacterium]
MKPVDARLRRRHFLRGFGGAIVGLPFLESLAPRVSRAQTTAIKRFGVFFCCNGVNMDHWFPQGDYGTLTEAHLSDTSNAPLLPHLDKLLFPRGIHMTPRGFGRDPGGADDHGKGMAHKLTAYPTDEDLWLAQGPSVDQVIAKVVNPGSDAARRPPTNLMVSRFSDYKAMGYISYTGPGQAVAAQSNPWTAYADLMNLGGATADGPAASDRVGLRRQSVIDLVSEQFSQLQKGPLSASDRQKLDQHLTLVRGLEKQLTTPGAGGLSCSDTSIAERAMVYDPSAGSGNDFDVLAERESEYAAVSLLQLDIIALSFACDATRVATMQFGNGAGGPTFKWDGMNHEYNHHKLSHGKVRDDCFGDSTDDGCDDVDGYQQMLIDIDTWHAGRYAHLLETLSSYAEEDGSTLLDNSLVMYTNELADGKGHTYYDLPYILAGSLAGTFKQGQYISMSNGGEDAPHNKLLNTFVNAMGIESDWFGLPEPTDPKDQNTMLPGVYEELLA